MLVESQYLDTYLEGYQTQHLKQSHFC